MAKKSYLRLSNRERQIMDILYRHGSATAAEIQAQLPDPPSYSAVRATLRILEQKDQVRHDHDGPRYVFRPAVNREKAKRTAVQHLLTTFFDGSAEMDGVEYAVISIIPNKTSARRFEPITTLVPKATANALRMRVPPRRE